jgi:hypothetical protein
MVRGLLIVFIVTTWSMVHAQSTPSDTLRMLHIPPVEDSSQVIGLIGINITVNRAGDVVQTSLHKAKTTITNDAVIEKYLKAGMKIKASPDPLAPEFRHGVVTYKLTVR